jgi:RHS repeat-associated protein
MSNAAGTKVWDIESRPFGDEPSIKGPGSLNLRFPGQYFDEESGVSQTWHRDYSAPVGRFTQPDSIGLLGGLNPYVYGDVNPVNRFDPTGLAPCSPEHDADCRAGCAAQGLEYRGCFTIAPALEKYWHYCFCGPSKFGDCTPLQHATYQYAVSFWCKRPRSCDGVSCCDEIRLRIMINGACAAARDRINKVCYRGGNKGHKIAADDARRARDKCVDALPGCKS